MYNAITVIGLHAYRVHVGSSPGSDVVGMYSLIHTSVTGFVQQVIIKIVTGSALTRSRA